MSENSSGLKRNYFWLPVLFFSSVALGFLGAKWVYERQESDRSLQGNYYEYDGGIMDVVLKYVSEYYVDTISSSRLQDKALAALLRQLDPHSEYIPPSHFKMVNEPLEGNFEGIGVEFNIIRDTVRVMNVVSGGPSEKAGILPGDRIIRADTIPLTGTDLTNEKVFRTLRGKGGSKVKVYVVRGGHAEPIEFTIVRDKIPIHSLEFAFMIRPGVAYLKFRQFSATTSEEFRQAMNRLASLGMKKMILDLRGNGGGYLNAAVDMADEFLPKGMRIVYTEGRKYPRKEYFSTEYGSFENGSLVVLVDENSASASEIVAGAIQDNDRAPLIGRRTFGKGLVQDQISLPNGGAIRLTIARYYTPVGRCIQKPYSENHLDYFMEEMNRFNEGELFYADSIKTDSSQKYFTPAGRVVYGGGGIVPDLFVPLDTSRFHSMVSRWLRSGRIHPFCFDVADKNRDLWRKKYPSPALFSKGFREEIELLEEWERTLRENEKKYMKVPLVRENLFFLFKAYCGRVIYGDEGFYPVWLSQDRDIKKALEVLMDEKKISSIIRGVKKI